MLEILTPAKINLGLEVIGKRPDGYHEIRTVFAAVSLFDRLSVGRSVHDRFSISDPALESGNLVERALEVWDAAGLHRPPLAIRLRKRIPAAAGLGGASSDAASTLIALRKFSEDNPPIGDVSALAAQIGSDVPFFLLSGLALASGRGEELVPLPPVDFAALIITPPLQIAAKTKSMFSALVPSDFSDGSTVANLAGDISRIVTESAGPLINSFERPLYDLYPELGKLAHSIRLITGRHPSVSGAGPSMFIPVQSIREAHTLRNRLAVDPAVRGCRLHCVRAITYAGPLMRNHD